MDFIKTSSPRALSELTLQRNWIGIIWMSRTQVMIKLVKTGPDGLIEHSHPEPRTPADRGTNVPRPCPHSIVAFPLIHGRSHVPTGRHRPACGPNITSQPTSCIGRALRTDRRQASRPRGTTMYRGRPIAARTGRLPPVTGQVSSAKTYHPSVVSRTRTVRTIVPTPYEPIPTDDRPTSPNDRPNRPVDPKPFLEHTIQAQCRADLARFRFSKLDMEKDSQVLDPIKAIPLRHIPPQRDLLDEQEMSNPQAPPPTWDSPPRLSLLKSKKNLLPYLEAADLETSSKPHLTEKNTF
ncbi:unnamed protein product [Microthlaspi erraticum]|uniref:Uncharacterized protein n=1 Tax=Microthlaspi erraticum TaxID=1685480 RepID=A0A6D2KGV7_9BRAS|nr:unnamed protein product [Microthlaspi erraticum]